jgi:hypothetical protein
VGQQPDADPLVVHALGAYTQLQNVINTLTPAQLIDILEFEKATKRRQAHIDRIIRRLVDLRARQFRQKLENRYKYESFKEQNNGRTG